MIAFLKSDATAFERLTLAARAWKELDAPSHASVLLGTPGTDAAQGNIMLDALQTAAMAATAPMPTFKSTQPKRSKTGSFTLLHEGARPDVSRSIAMDAGNHLARWLTALPPNSPQATVMVGLRTSRRTSQDSACATRRTCCWTTIYSPAIAATSGAPLRKLAN